MALPGSIIPIKCDLRIREDIETMFCVIKEKLMGVDVCINNAGLALDAPIIDGGYDAWEEMWHVSVRYYFRGQLIYNRHYQFFCSLMHLFSRQGSNVLS